MKAKLSTTSDLASVAAPCITTHACVQPPVPTPMPGPTLEADVPMNWQGGNGAGTHAVAFDVRHRGAFALQVGHDCGPGIPHITILPLPDPLTPLHMLFSSRRVVFGAATVRAHGIPLAVTGADLRTPMLTCGVAPTPTGVNATNVLASVDVGVTPADVTAGWGSVAEAVLVSAVLDHGMGATAPSITQGLAAAAFVPATGLRLSASGLALAVERGPRGVEVAQPVEPTPSPPRIGGKPRRSSASAGQPSDRAGISEEEPL